MESNGEELERELTWLRRARECARRLTQENDPSRLLPWILDQAIELAGAERGFLVRTRPGDEALKLKVEVARGFDGVSLKTGAGAISRRVVEQVLASPQGIVTTPEEDHELLGVTSVRERRVLAILCVPMRLRGKSMGAIYLDHRFRPDAFCEADREPLGLFADQAALALETAELVNDRQQAQRELDRAKAELREKNEATRRQRRLAAAHRRQRERPAGAGGLGGLIGDSEAAHGLFAELERAARSHDPVVLVGESGSGKTRAARELHRLGQDQAPGPLVEHHCLRLDARQLESALTLAAGGSLLLEGIESASSEVQATLSALLQEQRLGASSGAIPTERAARLLTTTPHPLSEISGLREDLLYRLDVLQVCLPPLRERQDDVPLLVAHFARANGAELELTPGALERLAAYDWPGNLHELANLVRRLLALGKKITRADLPEAVVAGARSSQPRPETMADMEKRVVREALAACEGNKSQAARRLGIQRSTLYVLLDRHGLR